MAQTGKTTILGADKVTHAFQLWMQRQRDRGKTEEQVVRYAMKIWVDFAFKKVKDRKPGNPTKIRSDLMTIVTRYSRRFKPGRRTRVSKVESEYAGTMAERVVWLLNYKDARLLRGAAKFRVVRSFVNARVFSAWHHKAGFFPAFQFLKKSPEDRIGPKYRGHPPGVAEIQLKDSLVEMMVENFASAAPVPGRPAPLGIGGLVPDAFEDSMPEVMEMLGKKALEDMMKDGMAAAGTVFDFKMGG